jgi:hypothetical protein
LVGLEKNLLIVAIVSSPQGGGEWKVHTKKMKIGNPLASRAEATDTFIAAPTNPKPWMQTIGREESEKEVWGHHNPSVARIFIGLIK